MRKRPTINDIARSAGVSISAVSFVLNDRSEQRISARVKRRVLAVAKRLNYHPRASAANLARRSTRNVVVLFPRNAELVPRDCSFSLIHGMVIEATRLDFNVLFSSIDSNYRAVTDLPKPIRECDAEGVLVINAESPDLLLDIQSCNIPVVSIDADQVLTGAGMFLMNDRRGGELAAEYLVNLGHKRLAVVTGRDCRPSFDDRVDGFVSGCRNDGIALTDNDSIVAAAEPTYDAGLRCGRELFRRPFRPTAVFAVTEELGAGILSAARGIKLRIPGDLSVLGFASTLLGPPIDPALTIVGADAECLGRYAISLLLDSVQKGSAKSRERIDVAIVTRTSTGPLSKRGTSIRPSSRMSRFKPAENKT